MVPDMVPGRADHQRHAQGALINEEAVRGLAMFAQTFTVVPGNDHQRIVVQPHARSRSSTRPMQWSMYAISPA